MRRLFRHGEIGTAGRGGWRKSGVSFCLTEFRDTLIFNLYSGSSLGATELGTTINVFVRFFVQPSYGLGQVPQEEVDKFGGNPGAAFTTLRFPLGRLRLLSGVPWDDRAAALERPSDSFWQVENRLLRQQ